MLLALSILVVCPQQESPAQEARDHQAGERRREETETLLPTRDWLGLRPWLERMGVEVEAFVTSDASGVLDGGIDPGATVWRALFDVTATVDAERAFGIEGGELFVDLQLEEGRDGSLDVGDAQAYSNIDAEDFYQVSELWYEQRFEALPLGVRVGEMDANGQFAWVEHGLRFIHSSMGFSPTIVGLPTYPETTFGATATVGSPSGRVELLAGVFEGVPSGSFLIAQLDASWDGGRCGVGAWQHTGTLDRFDGGRESGTDGLYLVLDQVLCEGVAADDDALGAFLQLGEADEAVAPLDAHAGLGAVWDGIGAGGDDAIGFGVSRARFSDEAGAGFGAEAETAFELFYSFVVGGWLRVKPDLQYVDDPGGDRSLDDAWVFTLRTTLSF